MRRSFCGVLTTITNCLLPVLFGNCQSYVVNVTLTYAQAQVFALIRFTTSACGKFLSLITIVSKTIVSFCEGVIVSMESLSNVHPKPVGICLSYNILYVHIGDGSEIPFVLHVKSNRRLTYFNK